MEALRACYIGDWRLHRDDPDRLTEGRYFFLPDDAPILPIPHPFASIFWWADQIDENRGIGNVFGKRRDCDTEPPPIAPDRRICGNLSHFVEGTTTDTPVSPSGVWGLPKCCFKISVPQAIRFIDEIDLTDRRMLCALSAIVRGSYDATSANVTALIDDLFGPPLDFEFVPNVEGTLEPGSILAMYDNYVVMFVSGTALALQWYTHVAQGMDGPTTLISGFHTVPNTNAAATIVKHRLDDMVGNFVKPIFVVGHSWGGAIAQVMLGRWALNNPSRKMKWLSFGGPKPGDQVLADRLNNYDGWRVTNFNDPVPLLPPSIQAWNAFGLGGLVPSGLKEKWNLFRHARNQILIDEDGELQLEPREEFFGSELVQLVVDIVAGAPTLLANSHQMIAYQKALCPEVEPTPASFPVSAESIEEAQGQLLTGPCPGLADDLELLVQEGPFWEGSYALTRTNTREWTALVTIGGVELVRYVLFYESTATSPDDYKMKCVESATGNSVEFPLFETPTCSPVEFNFQGAVLPWMPLEPTGDVKLFPV